MSGVEDRAGQAGSERPSDKHEFDVAEGLAELVVDLLVKNAPSPAAARENVRDLMHGALVGERQRVRVLSMQEAARLARKFRPEDYLASDSKTIQWHTAEEIARELDRKAKEAPRD